MVDRVPLPSPLYGATFAEAVSRFWRKYATFTGRASRSEFWWAYLFVSLVGTAIGLVLSVVFAGVLLATLLPSIRAGGTPSGAIAGPVVGIYIGMYATIFAVQLPLLIPTLAVIVRRLHDAGFSGLMCLLILVPGASLAVLILCVLDSNPAGARFDVPAHPATGSDPEASSTIRS